ncbi:MAG: nucleotidyltransferase domain-containing protein [Candidatus Omnitrophota bacterium]
MVKKEIITILQTFLKRLTQEGIPIEKAFLYGSYARGEENERSDIDVLLVSELFDKNDDQPVGKTWRIGSLVDKRIEPYTVGKQRFLTDQFSPLLQIVKQEGFEISA